MGYLTRRELMVATAAGLVGSVTARHASATIVRSVSLPELVRSSSRIVLATPLASACHYEDIGRKRRMVTDTRISVQDHIAKGTPPDAELLLRTLGGSIGSAGELVHGQAKLALERPCLLFLLQAPNGIHYVMGMAQGHYPVIGTRLTSSPDLGKILDISRSAVRELAGRQLLDATARLRAMSQP